MAPTTPTSPQDWVLEPKAKETAQSARLVAHHNTVVVANLGDVVYQVLQAAPVELPDFDWQRLYNEGTIAKLKVQAH